MGANVHESHSVYEYIRDPYSDIPNYRGLVAGWNLYYLNHPEGLADMWLCHLNDPFYILEISLSACATSRCKNGEDPEDIDPCEVYLVVQSARDKGFIDNILAGHFV